MALVCINGAKECDGCMSCQDRGESELICPICENELTPRDTVYVSHGEVIGCKNCIDESTARDELT